MPDQAPPIIRELEQVTRLAWTRVQDDAWNRLSLFVYQAQTMREVQDAARQAAADHKLPAAFVDYAVTRWYTQKTHDVVVDLFCQHPRVRRWHNPRDRRVDFEVDKTPFDLKLTHISAGRAAQFPLATLRTRPDQYIAWLYSEQSRQERFGLNNRLFVTCYDVARPNDSWKLKRDWERLADTIGAYLARPTYHAVALGGNARVISDVILVSK